MIDWKKSAELNNMGVDELKARFVRFPKSAKKVVVICDNNNCRKERVSPFHAYRGLCISCANEKAHQNDPTIKQRQREATIERYSDSEERLKTSKTMKKVLADPVIHKRLCDAHIKRWKNPVEHVKHSEMTKKRYAEMDDPGQEIVKHHYIYDFDDPTRYTIEITRSEHTTIHNNLRFAGLEVPHINIMKGDINE